MFLPQLLLGGGPLAGATTAAGTLGTAAAAGTALYAFRKKIPHPSEFACIGCCCLYGGCHHHPKFTLIVEVHVADNVPSGSKCYCYIECGRFDRQSQGCEVDPKLLQVQIQERLDIHIRQKDDFLKICLFREGLIKGTLLGETTLNIVKDIINEKYPQQTWYQLKKDGKSTVKLQLSFHRVDVDLNLTTSPLLQYALVQASKYAALSNGSPEKFDFEAMDEYDQIKFLSHALEGPLKKMGVTEWTPIYIKVVVTHHDRWQWVYWRSKDDMLADAKPKGKIPMLAISLVLPDSNDRKQFYVKYHTKSGARDLFFQRVDRDRNVWSDGLYEFLERLRAYYTSHPIGEAPSSVPRVKGEGIKLPSRSEATAASATIPQMSPSQRKLPVSIRQMIDDAMNGYDDEDPPDDTS